MRAVTNLPLAVGFGISTPEQVAQVGPLADAVVVGSAFVRTVSRGGDAGDAGAAASSPKPHTLPRGLARKQMTPEEALQVLADCRKVIDASIWSLLAILNERTKIVERIGQVKQECSMPIYEPKREDEVFRNVMEHNGGPLPPDAVKRIFERIIDEMRTLQKLRMDNKK